MTTPDDVRPPGRRAGLGRRPQAGLSMIDALLALAVLALALAGLSRLHFELGLATADARQRVLALWTARSLAEAQRAAAAATGLAGDAVPIETAGASPLDASTEARIESGLHGQGLDREWVVTVRWTDRRQARQHLSLALPWPLQTLEARDLAGVGRDGHLPDLRIVGAAGRHPGVPREAIDLGEGRSWLPAPGGLGGGWLIDDRSGAVLAACAVRPDPAPAGAALPAPCPPRPARIASGVIRFAAGPAPQVDGPYVDPLPVDVRWAAEGVAEAWPACDVRTHVGADPHVSWRCVVPAPAVPSVSTSETRDHGPVLVTHGWSLDGEAQTHRACRIEFGHGPRSATGPWHLLVVPAASDCPTGSRGIEAGG